MRDILFLKIVSKKYYVSGISRDLVKETMSGYYRHYSCPVRLASLEKFYSKERCLENGKKHF